MLLAWEGVLPWVEDPMKSYLVNDTIEGVASIHGDIHEGQHHQSLEKKHNLPSTNELSQAYLEFLWNQYALSDFWLSYVIITCPMYVPSTCTKTVVCTRHGAGQFSCEDSFWCMWPVTHALITRLSSRAFSVKSSSCFKSQGQRVVHRCWWVAGNPVDVRRHSTTYCLATAD